jgi:hypothetical protein
MSYLYNSIQSVLDLHDLFGFTVDNWFQEIRIDVQSVICSSRNILNVYSYNWPSIDQVGQLRFSRSKYRSPPTLTHTVRSMIIAERLSDWMSRLSSVIVNVEAKLM